MTEGWGVSMSLMYVTVSGRVPGAKSAGYEALFLVDTGATDSMAPASLLTNAGILPIGRTAYELADGTVHEYQFGLAQIEFMGEVTGPNHLRPGGCRTDPRGNGPRIRRCGARPREPYVGASSRGAAQVVRVSLMPKAESRSGLLLSREQE